MGKQTKTIAIVGPESTGKSVLSKQLALVFGAPYVAEYARAYFANHSHAQYTLADVNNIAQLQHAAIQHAQQKEPEILFLDTDLVTILIWMRDKFAAETAFVDTNVQRNAADLYLLCAPDLPWQPDPLREDEHRRNHLFETHKNTLAELGCVYKIIAGLGDARKKNAVRAVRQFLAE